MSNEWKDVIKIFRKIIYFCNIYCGNNSSQACKYSNVEKSHRIGQWLIARAILIVYLNYNFLNKYNNALTYK